MATQAQLLDGDGFNQLVLENGLKTWEQNGYVYAGMRGKSGWELYRAYGPKWAMLYQAARINTQNNAGGGALYVNISIASGMTAQLVSFYAISNGNATFGIDLNDEDNARTMRLANQGAAAGNNASLPSIGSTSASTGNIGHSLGLRIGPGQTLQIWTGAVANTNTLTVEIALLMPISATAADVTWTTTGSGGTPSLAASTISTANTLQAVLLP